MYTLYVNGAVCRTEKNSKLLDYLRDDHKAVDDHSQNGRCKEENQQVARITQYFFNWKRPVHL